MLRLKVELQWRHKMVEFSLKTSVMMQGMDVEVDM